MLFNGFLINWTLSDITCNIPLNPSLSYFFNTVFRLDGSNLFFSHSGKISLLQQTKLFCILNSEIIFLENTVISEQI